MTNYKHRPERIQFTHGVFASMLGIDGTWRRACVIEDVSDGGAKLKVEGSLTGLPLEEFFLLLTPFGLAYRRCELVWVNGDHIGVLFLKPGKKKPVVRAGPR
jgi:hypothetical protein